MLQNERVVAILCQSPAFMSHANITQMAFYVNIQIF